MGPKKKKQPHNAYYMFMLEFREKKKQEGATYSGGLKEVAKDAAPAWEKLTKEEKAVYEKMAKEEKEKEKNNLDQKFTTTGKSFHQVDLEAQERIEREAQMEREIVTTVAFLDKNAMQEHPFFFMHVNYYCRIENGQFIPCELALCRFNFLTGASKVFHIIVNPVAIPLGYAYDSKRRSDETHQIPLPPHDLESEDRFDLIYDEVLNFLKDGDANKKIIPPIYTHGSDGSMEAVQDVLDTLCGAKERSLIEFGCVHPKEAAGSVMSFRVYPLHKLFYELRNRARDLVNTLEKKGKVFPVESVAVRELEKDAFNWHPGIACKLHEGIDAKQFCCLSIVRRWSYILADHCCADLDIELEPGVHIAPSSSYEKRDHDSAKVVVSPREDPKKLVEPIIPTFIDHSKLKPQEAKVQEEENHFSVGRGRLAPCFSDVVRQPRSRGIALQNGKYQGDLSIDEFPPIGGPSSGNLPFGQFPVLVAGRGRGLARSDIKVKKGRGLSELTKNLSLTDKKL